MNHNVITSFVHGYNDPDINLPEEQRPALWQQNGSVSKCYNYPFPRNPADFERMEDVISGRMPLKNAEDFKKLPRFGLTGLQADGDFIYAGSWNGVYKIRRSDFELESIVSNNLMSDMHGIYVDDDVIITVLTGKDTVVISSHDGEVIRHFSVMNDLTVVEDKTIEEIDWRFISKQFRGSTGYWHFNFVQKFDNELWLTSRNANAFVVVNINTLEAHLRLMNLCTPALLHDGKLYNGRYYFSSIDGKVIITEDAKSSEIQPREQIESIGLYNRDLVSKVIRLNETEFGREPNWCRGIACKDSLIYVTVDGRYDTDLSFGLLALNEEGRVFNSYRLNWSEVGDKSEIRFVTGFDILILE